MYAIRALSLSDFLPFVRNYAANSYSYDTTVARVAFVCSCINRKLRYRPRHKKYHDETRGIVRRHFICLLIWLQMQEIYLYGVLGLPTWALVDGTWAVLSQLADTLPEGYDISAYLILSLTFGNIVPLLIGLLVHDATTLLKSVINVILCTGLVAGVLMAIVWDRSVSFGSTQASIPLFTLFFVVGACASSSNVTHFTYVSRSAAQNTTALATGMGIGSMTAGIVALLQGLALLQYGFSVTIYYIVLALLYVPAIIAFSRLNASTKEEVGRSGEDEELGGAAAKKDTGTVDNILMVPPHCETSTSKSSDETEYSQAVFLRENAALLCLQLVNASLGFGFVPALISFACGKFANKYLVLQLATGITAVIDPLSKFLTYYVRLESFRSLQIATATLVVLALGLILCAALPSELSLYQGAGGVVPVLLYVSFMALFGFTNTSIFRYFKCAINGHFVHHAYRWSGVCSQAGALLGSLVAFVVIVAGVLGR